jgi:hypothetical protein
MSVLEHIVGADRLVNRFGRWPSFHDAVIVRVTVDSLGVSGPSAEMLVHTWAMTDTVDEKGYYVLEKHTLVRFDFEQLTSCELSDFGCPAILFGLGFERDRVDGKEVVRVTLDPCAGFGGTLTCGRVVVADVAPCDAHGRPAGEG